MTRINLLPVKELTDQHLFAEFREIKMVPKSLERSMRSTSTRDILKKIPKQFTLNTGHVYFFYNKGKYLENRYEQIKNELQVRGINFNKDSIFDPDCIMKSIEFNNDYIPDEAAFKIIRERVTQKINMKRSWYRYYGKSLETL